MYTIERVEEQLYDPGNGGEPLIGLTIFYTDGGVNQIGPILIRSEMDALLKDAYNRGRQDALESHTVGAEVTE